MDIWMFAYICGIINTIMCYLLVISYGSISYFMVYYTLNILYSSVYGTIDFINIGSFCNRISDKKYGGTFLTFLASFVNLGSSASASLSLYLLSFIDMTVLVFLGLVYALLYLIFFFKKV